MHTKTLGDVRIKNADLGQIEAVFSTFDVVDHDGDVLRKEAFTDGAPVAIGSYGHRIWQGEPPVGKGVIRVENSRAVLDGQFFMTTAAGRDTFEIVKEMSADDGPGQEWSYSLRNVEATKGTVDGQRANIITAVDVHEVCPVIIGASIDTGTLTTKAAKQYQSDLARRLRVAAVDRWGGEDVWIWLLDWDVDDLAAVFEVETDDDMRLVRVGFTRDGDDVTLADDEVDVERTIDYAPKGGVRFSEQIDQVMTDVDRLITRTTEVVTLRAGQGKQLSPMTREQLADLSSRIERLKAISDDTTPTPGDDTETAARERFANEAARFFALTAGVTP